jgi:pimeloyl-ACP methyl ester carboxylesterase
MILRFALFTGLILFFASASVESADEQPEPLGIAMENYAYPFPVRYLDFEIEGQDVRMGYMDVKPAARANGETVVLMHGKNFFGAYWADTIRFLSRHGFRVVVPDQIGFGKSSKPDIYYSFHLLAHNTRRLLDELNVDKAAVLGHSMGGMLAARFALMYPSVTAKLILENPIGLEDYRLKVPFKTMEALYQDVLGYTEESIRTYHKTYYVDWKDEYETYVQVHYRWTLSGEYPRLAWASALTYQMVYTQPVVYEFPAIKTPTLLIIGQEDRTTLGRGELSQGVLATMGQYPQLGKKTAAAMQNAKLAELDNVGHIPHLEARQRFHAELLDFLKPKS